MPQAVSGLGGGAGGWVYRHKWCSINAAQPPTSRKLPRVQKKKSTCFESTSQSEWGMAGERKTKSSCERIRRLGKTSSGSEGTVSRQTCISLELQMGQLEKVPHLAEGVKVTIKTYLTVQNQKARQTPG